MQDYILTRFNSLRLSAILATSSVICRASGTWPLYTLSSFLHFTQIPSEKQGERVNTTKIIPTTGDFGPIEDLKPYQI